MYIHIYIFYVERFTEVVAPKCSVKKQTSVLFLYPLKTKTFGFLTFSGVLEMEHWSEMG